MKKFNLVLLSLFFYSALLLSQDNAWNFLNHASGGYVTAILPVKYNPGQQPPLPNALDKQVLYARTDIGGIYRSTNNGTTWDFNSCYYRTLNRNFAEVTASEFHVQGVAVRFDSRESNGTEHNVVVVAAGHDFYEGSGVNFKGIWRSNDNGNTGSFNESVIIDNDRNGIWFKGNNFSAKIGGENIIYDPNNINGSSSVMYAGGWYPSLSGDRPCYLYKSTNDGQNWINSITPVNTFPATTYQTDADPEGIICIYIKPGDNQKIFVGTTKRVVFTLDNGVTWQSRTIPVVSNPYVKRIIFKTVGSVTTAFAVWGYYDESGNAITGIGKLRSNNNYNYEPISFGSTPGGIFSALTFGNDEGTIFAGTHEGTGAIKKSTDEGTSWQVQQLKYDTPANNLIPTHSIEYQRNPISQTDNNIYSGMNQIVGNPNGSLISGASSQWYMSGGAGARTTATVGVTNNNLEAARWKYTVKGQTMPVMYDVVFKNLKFTTGDKQAVFMPMSDWTMSWEYAQNINPAPPSWMIPVEYKYDRHNTFCGYDTYISNVTRILFHPRSETNDPNYRNLSYCVGGSVYDYSGVTSIPPDCREKYFAGFYERRDNDGTGNNITRVRHEVGPFLNIPERAINDAIMYEAPGGGFPIIVVVGENVREANPNTTSTGIFRSVDGGISWTAGAFNLSSGDAISTQDAYNGSVIAPLAAVDGTVGDLFYGHFSLSHIGGHNVLVYLKESDGNHSTGGLFLSRDDGDTWVRFQQSEPRQQPPVSYFGPGSLKQIGVNQVALAVRTGSAAQSGLFISTINPASNPPTASWQSIGNFISAEHVEVYNGKYSVYGRRTGDKENQIYKSLDNGTTWTRIPQGFALPLFAVVNSLRIRPTDGSLWIATSGQGTFIYKQFMQPEGPQDIYITVNTTYNYSMYFTGNIYVQNGATLTLENGQMDFIKDAKIEVQQGSSIICNNVTFGCPLGTWQGITMLSAANSSFTACTFNNAVNPIKIDNSQAAGYSTYRKSVINCVFNMPSVTGTSYCIVGYETENLNVYGCTFQMTGNQSAQGIYIENMVGSSGGAAGPMGPAPSLAIQFSNFYNGGTQINLNCLSAGITNTHINSNSFNKTLSGYTVGLYANNIAGNFKYNKFTSTSFDKEVVLFNCNLKMFANSLIGTKNSNLEMDVNTTAQLSPLILENGTYIWYGGENKLEMLNTNPSTAGNVSFTEGCTFMGDKGRNCFTLSYTQNNNHVSGYVQCSGFEPYYLRNNYWNTGSPLANIQCQGSPMQIDYLPTINCPIEEDLMGIITGYQVTDLGNGVYDTVFITSTPGGSGNASGNEDRALFGSAMSKKSIRDYQGAITDLKNLLTTQDSSKLLLPAIDELFINYKLSDTTRNQNNTNALFGELKSYIEARMQQYSSKPSFVDKAYRYFLMSLGKMKQYSEAISGYENIMQNHPNPVTRLTASWDRAATVLLMNGGGGGKSDESTEILSQESLEKLFDRNPAHKIAFDSYKQEKEQQEKEQIEIEDKVSIDKTPEDKDGKKINSNIDKRTGYDKSKVSEIGNRVSNFNPSNRPELSKKVQEDLNILLGLNKVNNITNTEIPKEFSLYQNYPNPFNPLTKINYSLPRAVKVNIQVYDILGSW